MHITNQFSLGISINAHVNHTGSRLDPVASHQFGATDCGNQNIGAATLGRQVFGA